MLERKNMQNDAKHALKLKTNNWPNHQRPQSMGLYIRSDHAGLWITDQRPTLDPVPRGGTLL